MHKELEEGEGDRQETIKGRACEGGRGRMHLDERCYTIDAPP